MKNDFRHFCFVSLFSVDEIADIMGLNWLRFYEKNFGALAQGETTG